MRLQGGYKQIEYVMKHGLVKEVIDWPYSSFHRYVSEGLLPKNWSREFSWCDFGE
ncbi:hypothetical protein Lfee_0657 [Legionella feeleii]|uniref:Transposase n=1 Tax=Legionella feeleii TaxID=453 RepID=A0A0W0U443_9GAMM|nr:hypothetical protein Lfee_0657 [Legionella feeleii]SPX59912.1 Uncharacterised protein [Legionella feeleii]